MHHIISAGWVEVFKQVHLTLTAVVTVSASWPSALYCHPWLCMYCHPWLCRYYNSWLCMYCHPRLCMYCHPWLCMYCNPWLCSYSSLFAADAVPMPNTLHTCMMHACRTT